MAVKSFSPSYEDKAEILLDSLTASYRKQSLLPLGTVISFSTYFNGNMLFKHIFFCVSEFDDDDDDNDDEDDKDCNEKEKWRKTKGRNFLSDIYLQSFK